MKQIEEISVKRKAWDKRGKVEKKQKCLAYVLRFKVENWIFFINYIILREYQVISVWNSLGTEVSTAR